jgi:hypothetical protein
MLDVGEGWVDLGREAEERGDDRYRHATLHVPCPHNYRRRVEPPFVRDREEWVGLELR